MKIIVNSRCSGKTYSLLHMVNHKNGYIVCVSRREADRVKDMADRNGFDINMPITFDEARNLKRVAGMGMDTKYFIDNADILLQTLISGPVEAITLSGTVE